MKLIKTITLGLVTFTLGTLVTSAQSESIISIPKNRISLNALAQTRGVTIGYERVLYSGSIFALTGKAYLGYGFSGKVGGKGGNVYLSTFYQNEALLLSKPERMMQVVPSLKQVNLGVEGGVLLGKSHHFAEIGLGWGLDFSDKAVNYFADRKTLGATPTDEGLTKASPSKLGDHFNLRAGYLYVAPYGLTVGAGLSMHFYQGLFTYYYAYPNAWIPYLSLGWAF